jgi:hypothetical protein
MMKSIYIWYVVAMLGITMGCKKPYEPPVVSSDNHYLVVEGVINSGNDSTFISLSRTVKLSENVSTQPVTNFTVVVEGEQGAKYTLNAQGNGKYNIGPMNLDASKKYRLHLTEPGGKEYVSDYVEVRQNPPVDSIGFAPRNNNLQLYVNTHNSANNTRYYRWDYAETWRFHARYQASYIVDPATKEIRFRRPEEDIYYCFGNDDSNNIILASSEKLSQDVISQGPITTIANNSEKIEERYTILLKQYALTKDGYQFWENLKKNTEQLGSIFDAQPSQLKGNIHNINDPSEPVIGYVSVTNIQSKRIFIDNTQLPQEWIPRYPYDCHQPDSALFSNPLTMINEVKAFIINGNGIPVSAISTMGGIAGYTYSSQSCVDCTIRGKIKQPSFWREK